MRQCRRQFRTSETLAPTLPLLQSQDVSFSFEIEARADSARLGQMTTPHGVVETPVFMPVGTVASVKGVSQDILEDLGVQILLGNTYHLYLRPGWSRCASWAGCIGSWPGRAPFSPTRADFRFSV